MKKNFKISLFALFMAVLPATNLFSQSEEENVQMIVHLLSYVSMDYSEAVKDGKVIDEDEYKEQIEFSAKAYQLARASSILKDSKEEILKDLQQLIKLVDEKKEANKISTQVTLVKDKIIKITGIKTSPKNWPNLEAGKAIYAQSCTECHGVKGDGLGQLAQALDPKPSNFLETEHMQKISPYQTYNTIRLGVEGTSMRPFTELTEEQAWDLAFYVKSMLYATDSDNTQKLQKEFDTLHSKVTLEQVSTLSDNDLQEALKEKVKDVSLAIKTLRASTPTKQIEKNSLPIVTQGLKEALNDYVKGDKASAKTKALKAYLEGFEPMEDRLRAINSKFVPIVEKQIHKARKAIEEDEGEASVTTEINKSLELIEQANQMITK